MLVVRYETIKSITFFDIENQWIPTRNRVASGCHEARDAGPVAQLGNPPDSGYSTP